MKVQHLTSIKDLDKKEILKIFNMSKKLKGKVNNSLQGKVLLLYFEKPSTRTRISFQTAMAHLGGSSIYTTPHDMQLSRGETLSDTDKVLSRYVNVIVARTYKHETITDLVEHSSIPIINGLSNLEHPCQVLADLFTILEKRKTLDLNLAWIGDGNNVCNSFIEASKILKLNLKVSTPHGYEPSMKVLEGSNIQIEHDPIKAVKDADVVITDTWVSMGEESEREKRIKGFHRYQVNSELVKHASKNYLFMHCLPAHRGYEVTDEIIDGQHSVVFDEAENRLHVQKAILQFLLK